MKDFPFSKSTVVQLATLGYQAVLSLYPAAFRTEYGPEMLDMFQERCSELYKSSGKTQVGGWLILTLAEEFRNIYEEYLDIMTETFRSRQDARGVMNLGLIFLIGTWIAIFFLAKEVLPFHRDWVLDSNSGLLPGTVLVSINASFVARALTRSKRFEYVAGMAAILNIFLISSLMAVHIGVMKLGSHLGFRILSVGLELIVQGSLFWIYGRLMWRMRGEDLTYTNHIIQTGD